MLQYGHCYTYNPAISGITEQENLISFLSRIHVKLAVRVKQVLNHGKTLNTVE